MSTTIKIPITLRLGGNPQKIPLVAHLGDVNSYDLDVTLMSDADSLYTPSGTVRAWVAKPDHHVVFKDCTVDATTGHVHCIVGGQMVTAAGEVLITLKETGDDYELAFTGIVFTVRKGAMDENAVESTDDFSVLQKTIDKVEQLLTSLTTGVVDARYVFLQETPAKIWNINHSLAKWPSVSVVDSAGSIVVGEVSYIDENNVTLTFSAAFAGRAFFN